MGMLLFGLRMNLTMDRKKLDNFAGMMYKI